MARVSGISCVYNLLSLISLVENYLINFLENSITQLL